MLLLGCRPPGRNTEQHDIFFGIAHELRDLVPEIKAFWKDASPIHVDAWRIVKNVDGFEITVADNNAANETNSKALFFLNIGGYKPNEFEEFHYKILTVADSKVQAIKTAKESTFYKHTGFKGAASHIDDRFGVDVDDVFEIKDILPAAVKAQFSIVIEIPKDGILPTDEMHLGYLKLHDL